MNDLPETSLLFDHRHAACDLTSPPAPPLLKHALAASGPYGVVDKVRTRDADQRRGLGRTVMTMLANRALDEGLTTGVLSATEQGRHLYAALGWTIRDELAGAYRSE